MQETEKRREQVVGRGRKPGDDAEAGKKKKNKQEEATKCFLVSSGG